MSKPQIIQMLVTFAGMALALTAFLAGPFDLLGNILLSLGIFFAAGALAGYAYARLAPPAQKIADLRDRVDNPPA